MKKIILSVILLFSLVCVDSGAKAPMSIVREKDKIYIDIPDSLLGRKFLLNTIITSCTSPYFTVMEDISSSKIFTLSRQDSTLLLSTGTSNWYVADAEGSVSDALANSNVGEICFRIPFKAGGADSTSYRIDAEKLFDPSNKNVVNLKGMGLLNYDISDGDYSSSKSEVLAIEEFGSSVGVSRELSFDLSLKTRFIVVDLDEKEPVTFRASTLLTLVDTGSCGHKFSDPRIGTATVPVSVFGSQKPSDSRRWIRRWDLSGQKTADIYVDTLLTPAQRAAVYDAFEQWNVAFAECGMGKRIRVMDYPSQGFNAHNPLASIVTVSGMESSLTAGLLTDGSDRILSARFFIPGGYAESVRRRAIVSIADTDPRYQDYYLCEDAVCEVLKADMMRVAGLCLGLTPNYAGSMAYTPQQIRDPEFTAKYGFTASVTDDVLFNYLALPGDKERGVSTVVDKIGEYDKYAIAWIYSDAKPDSKHEHFYAPLTSDNPDPRVRRYDLSNDNFAAFDAGLSHLKFMAQNAAQWLKDEDIPESSYVELFIDWLWLRANNLMFVLTSNVGAYRYNDPRYSSEKKYIPLDKAVQKRSLETSFAYLRDLSYLDESELLHMAGANKNTSDFTWQNAFKLINATARYKFVARSYELAGSDYSPEEYFGDIESQVFKNLSEGRFPATEMFVINGYLGWLAGNTDVSRQDVIPGISELSYIYLDRALDRLKKYKSRLSSKLDRSQLDFLIGRYER